MRLAASVDAGHGHTHAIVRPNTRLEALTPEIADVVATPLAAAPFRKARRLVRSMCCPPVSCEMESVFTGMAQGAEEGTDRRIQEALDEVRMPNRMVPGTISFR